MDFFGKYRYRSYYQNNPSFVEPLVYTNPSLEQPNTVFRRQCSVQPMVVDQIQPYTPSVHKYNPVTPAHTTQTPLNIPFHWTPQAYSVLPPEVNLKQSNHAKKRVSFSQNSSVCLIPTRNEYDNKLELWWTAAEIVNMRSNRLRSD